LVPSPPAALPPYLIYHQPSLTRIALESIGFLDLASSGFDLTTGRKGHSVKINGLEHITLLPSSYHILHRYVEAL
jgi:hypothetical protein